MVIWGTELVNGRKVATSPSAMLLKKELANPDICNATAFVIPCETNRAMDAKNKRDFY